MSNGICKLCEKVATLKESHIVPKSIYKWLKDTSATSYMRNMTNPNVRTQDGLKTYLLCEECEQRFSIFEKYFKEKFFLVANKQTNLENINPFEIEYDNRLFYFILSVWWRMIHFSMTDKELTTSKYWSKILDCEKELKRYLLTFDYPINYDRVYLLPVGYVKSSPHELKN